jgi:hypothetical protein
MHLYTCTHAHMHVSHIKSYITRITCIIRAEPCTDTCIYVWVYIYICTHARVFFFFTYMYAYMQMQEPVLASPQCENRFFLGSFFTTVHSSKPQASVRVHTHAYIHGYVCYVSMTHTNIHTMTHTNMHTCKYFMHALYTYIGIWSVHRIILTYIHTCRNEY